MNVSWKIQCKFSFHLSLYLVSNELQKVLNFTEIWLKVIFENFSNITTEKKRYRPFDKFWLLWSGKLRKSWNSKKANLIKIARFLRLSQTKLKEERQVVVELYAVMRFVETWRGVVESSKPWKIYRIFRLNGESFPFHARQSFIDLVELLV